MTSVRGTELAEVKDLYEGWQRRPFARMIDTQFGYDALEIVDFDETCSAPSRASSCSSASSRAHGSSLRRASSLEGGSDPRLAGVAAPASTSRSARARGSA
jgi:hypothetical protein